VYLSQIIDKFLMLMETSKEQSQRNTRQLSIMAHRHLQEHSQQRTTTVVVET
jgi:hypothetical protein